MITVEIDGQTIRVERGTNIIEAADKLGINIPRFCYHKKLDIAANCRMCLVEVEKVAKPVPACATPLTDSMKILTKSDKVLEAQKAVMEFLLINHPLDCPICDQGGECELQDVALGFGQGIGYFTENKRVVKDKNLGSLIATDMTRCIHCTRCVRFGEKIAGMPELGATGRGSSMQIGTYIESSVNSSLSGNMIDICPVGALTSKPYRYKARGWELSLYPSISPHDSFGSNLYHHVKKNKIMRTTPKENEKLNEVWLSDKDRFSYESVASENRLLEPKFVEKGHLSCLDWEQAATQATMILGSKLDAGEQNNLLLVVSPNSTNEELRFLYKAANKLRIKNIVTSSNIGEIAPGFDKFMSEKFMPHISFIVGANLNQDLPLLELKFKQAIEQNHKVLRLDSTQVKSSFEPTIQLVADNNDMAYSLAKIIKAILVATKSGNETLISKFHKVEIEQQHLDAASDLLTDSEEKIIVLGEQAMAHPDYNLILEYSKIIEKLSKAKLVTIPYGANSYGSWAAQNIWNKNNKLDLSEVDTVLLFKTNILDLNNNKIKKIVSSAENVISFNSFSLNLQSHNNSWLQLPVNLIAEDAGSYYNVARDIQPFAPVLNSPGVSKSGLDSISFILKDLLPDLETYKNISELKIDFENQELLSDVDTLNSLENIIEPKKTKMPQLFLCAHNLFKDDMLRNSEALQSTEYAKTVDIAYANYDFADKYNLQENATISIEYGDSCEVVTKFKVDNSIPDGVIFIAYGNLDLNYTDNYHIKGITLKSVEV